MRAVSKKRAAEIRVYTKLRKEFLTDPVTGEPVRCEFPDGCEQASAEVHHKRGRVGALFLDVTHWAALCHDHHAWATGNPAAAYALGISERRIGGAV